MHGLIQVQLTHFRRLLSFVKVIENRQGVKVSAVEEIAYVNGWIDKEQLLESAAMYGKSSYGAHLKKVAEGKYRY